MRHVASRLSLVGGYEYQQPEAGERRRYFQPASPLPPRERPVRLNNVFTQPNSNKNTFTVGVEEKWSPEFNTFLRYKFISTDYPLYGITPDVGQLDAALNSALPTQENRVELGCTWTPTDCLMVNATLYVENAMSNAPYVAWTSNSLPFTVSAWWAPTPDWSFSVGAAEMDSWINQNVNLSNLNAIPRVGRAHVPWQFTGVADVFNLGSRYQATEKLSFTGEFEYVHGINSSAAIVDPTKQTARDAGAGYDAPTTSASTRWSRCSRSAWARGPITACGRASPCTSATTTTITRTTPA